MTFIHGVPQVFYYLFSLFYHATGGSTKMQSMKNIQGEVKFRQKVYQQDLGKTKLIGWYSKHEIEQILSERVKKLSNIYKKFIENDLNISPCLELAAGRCQFSMMLEDAFKLSTYATDISFEALKSSEMFKTKLKFSKLPVKIQCNIENLPFADNSFRHVAVWASLHHFKDPSEAILETKRVLSDKGTFFIGGEPIRPLVNIPLVENNLKKPSLLLRLLWRLKISAFFTYNKPLEEEYGIIENSFKMNEWNNFFSKFDKILYFEIIPKDESAFFNKIFSTNVCASLYGGSIDNVLLQVIKTGTSINKEVILICPNCDEKKVLESNESHLFCTNCNKKYPIKDGIIILLSDKDERLINSL